MAISQFASTVEFAQGQGCTKCTVFYLTNVILKHCDFQKQKGKICSAPRDAGLGQKEEGEEIVQEWVYYSLGGSCYGEP